MKKRFTKILSLVLVAVAAMSLSITSFAADNKPAPITPTAETTLGEVLPHHLRNILLRLQDVPFLPDHRKRLPYVQLYRYLPETLPGSVK